MQSIRREFNNICSIKYKSKTAYEFGDVREQNNQLNTFEIGLFYHEIAMNCMPAPSSWLKSTSIAFTLLKVHNYNRMMKNKIFPKKNYTYFDQIK